MTIDLVPSGGEQGQKKRTEEMFIQAGIPATSRQGTVKPKSNVRPQRTTAMPGEELDALEMREPQPGPFQMRQTDESRFVGMLEQSPSPVLKDLARRIRRL